ncbi:MAG: hypothetical protein D6776_06120, partial [Planctomycetota bacterium]
MRARVRLGASVLVAVLAGAALPVAAQQLERQIDERGVQRDQFLEPLARLGDLGAQRLGARACALELGGE